MEGKNSPEVSIVIVCMNRLDILYPCLHSIAEHTSVDCEVLVVAYMFSAENLNKAKADFPYVKWIESNEIRGFSENNNLALKQAAGRYCFVVNDDVEFTMPVIEPLLEDVKELPDAGIISPRLLNEDGSLQLCGRPPYTPLHYVEERFHLYSEPKDDTAGKEPVFGNVFRTSNICGAAFLIRTDVFRELEWFDERFFFTPEDIALSTLAVRKGYGVYVDSGVSVIHKWHKTASSITPATHPAGMRGTLIFLADGSAIRYLALGVMTYAAQMAKRIKAALIYAVRRDESSRRELLGYRHETRSIFTRRSPKEIFIKYYRLIKS